MQGGELEFEKQKKKAFFKFFFDWIFFLAQQKLILFRYYDIYYGFKYHLNPIHHILDLANRYEMIALCGFASAPK